MTDTKSTLAQIRQERLGKIEKLKQLGINPYPSDAQKDVANQIITDEFGKYEGGVVSLTGRIMSWREHGQLVFGHIQDRTGKVQLYIKSDVILPTSKDKQTIGFEHLNLLDVGDFVQARGEVTKTKRGEISILVQELKILTKAIRPLPEKRKGLQQKEERYRRRYLDMTMNPEVRAVFERRAKFWDATRDFLQSRGFIEIHIPVLEHVTGGADATPFVTHMNALDTDYYLRISQELPLKRLIGGGFEKVFEIGPRFRNEGISDEHLPEHMAMEYYWAYANYKKAMKLNIDMYRYIAQEVYGSTKFKIGEMAVDLADEWREIDFIKIMKETFGIDVFESSLDELKQAAKKHNIVYSEDTNRSRLIDTLWKDLRKTISGPAFLINEPKFLSPLAKSKPSDKRITERYHILIAGSELGNGYSELNDPVDQYNRFLEQQMLREGGDDEAQMMDIDFVEMLEYGMPPTTGFGLSERVFWYLESLSAREATPFPHLRVELEETTKEIYPEFMKLKQKSEFKFNESSLDELEKVKIAVLDEDLEDEYDGLKFGYLVLENVQINQDSESVKKLKAQIEPMVQSRYKSKSDIKKSKNIEGFRIVYEESGVDPNSRLNSAEAIIRRVVDGKGIYFINNLVDTYNLLSAYLELPMAAYDLDKIQGKLVLKEADGGENIVRIGESDPIKINKGELIYEDEIGVTCMDFNYRDADRTKITKDTKRAIVFVDGHQDISKEDIVKALSILKAQIESQNIGKISAYGTSWDE